MPVVAFMHAASVVVLYLTLFAVSEKTVALNRELNPGIA